MEEEHRLAEVILSEYSHLKQFEIKLGDRAVFDSVASALESKQCVVVRNDHALILEVECV